jgi:hypothetical protein
MPAGGGTHLVIHVGVVAFLVKGSWAAAAGQEGGLYLGILAAVQTLELVQVCAPAKPNQFLQIRHTQTMAV